MFLRRFTLAAKVPFRRTLALFLIPHASAFLTHESFRIGDAYEALVLKTPVTTLGARLKEKMADAAECDACLLSHRRSLVKISPQYKSHRSRGQGCVSRFMWHTSACPKARLPRAPWDYVLSREVCRWGAERCCRHAA